MCCGQTWQHYNSVSFQTGPSTNGNINLQPQPAYHHHHHQQQQQSTSQQQEEHHHCSSIHAKHRRKFRKLCKKKGIQVHFKGTNTLRTALGNPKDKDPKNNQTGIIYHYQCPQINCPSAYIGESGRSLGERVKEHFKAPSPIHLCSSTTGHPMDPEQFNIVHKDGNSHSMTIKEAMFICMQDPTLKRNLGKYQLPHIWDHLLLASPTLQCKPSSIPTTPTPITPPLVPLSPSSHCPYWQGAHTFMVSTHVCPQHTPTP